MGKKSYKRLIYFIKKGTFLGTSLKPKRYLFFRKKVPFESNISYESPAETLDIRFFNLHKLKTKGISYMDIRFFNLHKLKSKGIFYMDIRFFTSN